MVDRDVGHWPLRPSPLFERLMEEHDPPRDSCSGCTQLREQMERIEAKLDLLLLPPSVRLAVRDQSLSRLRDVTVHNGGRQS